MCGYGAPSVGVVGRKIKASSNKGNSSENTAILCEEWIATALSNGIDRHEQVII